jgi:micrococcal nuclease
MGSLTGIWLYKWIAPVFVEGSYRVVRVIDGDTIDVMNQGSQMRVRLKGVSAPETGEYSRPEEPYGKKAKDALIKILNGHRVYLEPDTIEGKDHWGRQLAYVRRCPDGLFVQRELLRNGLAHVTKGYPIREDYKRIFEQDEQSAKEKKLGMWSR